MVWSTWRGGSCGPEGPEGVGGMIPPFPDPLPSSPGAVLPGIGHHLLSALLPSQGLETGRRRALPPASGCGRARPGRGAGTWHSLGTLEHAFAPPCAADRPTEAERDEQGLQLVPSYPRAVIVPRSADNEAVALSARFRPGGR